MSMAYPNQQNFGAVLPQGSSGTGKIKESYVHLEQEMEKSAVLCGSTGEKQQPNDFRRADDSSQVLLLLFIKYHQSCSGPR